MRSHDKLTEEEIKHDELHSLVLIAIARYGGNRKTWHAAMKKKIADFPAERTLYDYTSRTARRELYVYNALMRGLKSSANEIAEIEESREFEREGILEEDDLYLTINKIIDRINNSEIGIRKIRLCAMHGTDQRRQDNELHPPNRWKGFVERMGQCIKSKDWRVEVLYNVPSIPRLDQIRARLRQAEDAENHEVRAYGIEGSLQLLCPLIIGDRDGFLAISHARFYRSGQALYVHGKDRIAFIERYWELLWSRARVIRSEAGQVTSEIEKLENEIKLMKRVEPQRQIKGVR